MDDGRTFTEPSAIMSGAVEHREEVCIVSLPILACHKDIYTHTEQEEPFCAVATFLFSDNIQHVYI